MAKSKKGKNAEETKNKGGRPAIDRQPIYDWILEVTATTHYGIRTILQLIHLRLGHSIVSTTFYKWLDDDEVFAAQYARAKEAQADLLVEQMIEIADDDSQDTTVSQRGNIVADNEFINRSRLKVETRKWIAAKLRPKKYGEKIAVEPGSEGRVTEVVWKITYDDKAARNGG